MTPRKVVLTLEVETDVPLTKLRKASEYSILMIGDTIITVLQAQANIVKP